MPSRAPVLDARVRRVLRRSPLWLSAGAGMLWLLVFGVGALLVIQVFRQPSPVELGSLVALVDLVLLMLGLAGMALSLGRQRRVVRAVLGGEASPIDVLRLVRQFWWIFAVTLVTFGIVGCAAIGTGAANAVWILGDGLETPGEPP